jgi:hypothetical protein
LSSGYISMFPVSAPFWHGVARSTASPRDRPHCTGDGPGPWPGSLPGPWFLARVLPEARCQGWPKAIS